MARPKGQTAVLMASVDDVEAEFYESLQRADIERLMAVWSDDDEIFCVHPGGPRVVGPAAIRATFEAIFANGVIPVRPEKIRRVESAGCAVHSLIERVDIQTTVGRADGVGHRHQRLLEDRPGVASGGAPRQPGLGAGVARQRRRADDDPLRMRAYRAPAWLPGGHLQTIWAARFARRHTGQAPSFVRERWTTPDGDFIDVDIQAGARRRTLAGGLPRPRGLVRQPLHPGLRLGGPRGGTPLRRAALSRLLGRAEPGAAGLPLRRLRGDRLDPGAAARTQRGTAAGGGRIAGRQCAAALGRGGRRQRCAQRLPRWPPSVRRSTSRPAGTRSAHGFNRQVYTRLFLRTDEAARAGQAGPVPGPVRPPSDCSPRATCTSSTTCSPRRCTASSTPTTTGLAPRPSRTCTRSASRRWCSTRATTRSCRLASLPAPSEVGDHVTLWQPAHGGHVGFAGRRAAGPCA